MDDKEVDNKKIPHIILFLVTLDETFRAVLYGGVCAGSPRVGILTAEAAL